MADTVLGEAVEFLQDFGFFDVILPFLLVFTIVFGVLEKTKIFGTEMIGGKPYPKKNINSMMAFVVAFFVVTAKEIVAAIQTSLPMVSLILLAIVSFLMLIGSLATGENEFNFLEMFKGWRGFMVTLFFIAIVGIFFQSFGWLQPLWDYVSGQGQGLFIILVFVAIVGGVISFVIPKAPKEDDD